MYAIVDIETTGGKFNEEGITEIAIYKHDGHEVIDQFISLVNPEKEIQPFVVNLTGINNKMLRNAPKFYEVAKRIVEITEDCILVAHNASFDYRILKTEFKRLGFDFVRENLCTVELSKQLIPDQPSYSLGKLVRSLGIPITDRHRAAGDAIATIKLFDLLLAKDTNKEIVKKSIKGEHKSKKKSEFVSILETLPNETGVYYMHRSDGEIIYVGKSKNIKNRVNQHFTSATRKSVRLQKMVTKVTYDVTGSELVALLKECEAIKTLKPSINRSLKGHIFSFGLYSFTDHYGYTNLTISRINDTELPITTFTSKQRGLSFLESVSEEFGLCNKLTGLDTHNAACFNSEIDKCDGACSQKEPVDSYNKKVNAIIEKYQFSHQNMIIVDKGRKVDEKTAVLIKNGEFKGLGYFNLNHQLNNIDVLETLITPMSNNRDSQHIIQSYLRKNKRLKIISLDK